MFTARLLFAISPLIVGFLCLILVTPEASAQFDQPIVTSVRERIGGEFIPGSSGPVPEDGDQIGAFFNDTVSVGFFQFGAESAQSREFSITLYGKVSQSDPGNGPARGQRVTFKYYRSSTNETIPLRVLNARGDTVNFTFQGQDVPPIDIPGFNFGDLLTPSRAFNLAPATGDGGNGGGGGGGGGTPSGNPDVNGDGVVDRRDAAIILRLIIGGPATQEERGRADVNGDGVVDTRDVIEVYRVMNNRPVPEAPSRSLPNRSESD